MNTAELKLDLINHITSITDKARLKEILQQLKFQNDESIYITSEEEKYNRQNKMSKKIKQNVKKNPPYNLKGI